MSTLLRSLSNDLADLHAQARRSLVQIHMGNRGAGSGAVWSDDGLIVTNAHVVRGRRGTVSHQLQVTLSDGRQLPADVVAVHPHHDLALLRVQTEALAPIAPGDSRGVRAGELVFALGYPWGVEGGATAGVVIGVGADLPELGDGRRDWIAAALQLRPGHSGGPMLDSRGRLVGINTLMTGPAVGAAVPVHVIDEFVSAYRRAESPAPADRIVRV